MGRVWVKSFALGGYGVGVGHCHLVRFNPPLFAEKGGLLAVLPVRGLDFLRRAWLKVKQPRHAKPYLGRPRLLSNILKLPNVRIAKQTGSGTSEMRNPTLL